MKLAVLLHDGPADRTRRRELLLGEVAPDLLPRVRALTLSIADEHADVPGPNPFQRGRVPVGLVDADLDEAEVPAVLERLRGAGFRLDAYAVDTTIPTTYGDTPHGPAFTGGTGERSPGVLAVNLLRKRPDLDDDEFVRRWHGRMSPVSGAIQPRTRYVRHHVRRVLTEGSPAWGAIVAEGWPSPRHVTNPFLFYGARTPWGLVWNAVRIVAAVRAITDIASVRTVMTSEYVLRP